MPPLLSGTHRLAQTESDNDTTILGVSLSPQVVLAAGRVLVLKHEPTSGPELLDGLLLV